MLSAYDETLPYRIAFAVAFFSILGIGDWIQHPEHPTRLKEYLFLIVTMLIAMVYGLIHDHLTATISAEYFLHAKGLDGDPRPFRVAVSLLATKATYGPGLLTGALLLIANNPAPEKPQLSYPHLLRLCVYPVLAAVIAATIGGTLAFAFREQTWLRDVALTYASEDRAARFMSVWGIHAGSYAGGISGTVIAIVTVRRRRRQRTWQDGALRQRKTTETK